MVHISISLNFIFIYDSKGNEIENRPLGKHWTEVLSNVIDDLKNKGHQSAVFGCDKKRFELKNKKEIIDHFSYC